MADDNKTVEIILKVNAAQFRKGMVNATGSYTASTGKMVQSSNEASAGVGNLTSKVLSLGAAYLSVSQSISLVKQLLATGGNFESLRVQLETLTGSAEAGEQAFAWIRDFVKETPFGLDAVTQGFIKLKAFGLDPLDGTYQAIADQAAALGGGQEKLNGIILAVGQAWAKQKLQGEEILQLVERGVPVWDLLAQATGKNVQELQKLSEQGKLGRDVIADLLQEMGKGVGGAALDQVDTWNGLVSNARVEWQSFLDTIAQSGALDFFKDELRDLLAEVERLAESGELQEYAQEVGEAIVGLAKTLQIVVGLVADLSGAIKLLVEFLVVKKLLSWGSAMVTVARATLAAATATQKLARAQRVLKAGLTFGLTIALDILISKAIEMSEASDSAAEAQEDLAREIAEAQQDIRREMAKPVDDQVGKTLNAALQAQKDFNSEFAKAKAAETNAIRGELARQLALYDQHLKDLSAAQNQQKAIAEEFARFVRDIAGGSGENDTPDIVDFYGDLEQAKTQLREGDFDGAIEGARNLADMVKAMRDNGEEADIILRELARQTELLANDAASQKVDKETRDLEQAELIIKELVRDAAFLKEIEIGFDQALASRNVDEIRQLLQQRLAQNPLVMPVQLGPDVDLRAANELLENNGANNPLIPDVPQIDPDTSPVVRPVELDTSKAEQQLKDLTSQIKQPEQKQVYVSNDGRAFSDRSNAFSDDFRLESLKTGRRK